MNIANHILKTIEPSAVTALRFPYGFDPEKCPELQALKGVPQPAKHHPEIDTYVHVEMAIDQALKLTSDPAIIMAVWLHDLGKGITRPEDLPSHPGHEQAGVPLVEKSIFRLPVHMWDDGISEMTDLCVMVCEHHTICHRAHAMTRKGLYRFFRHVLGDPIDEVVSNTEKFEKFLIACEADARGRLGLEDREYSQPAYLRKMVSEWREDAVWEKYKMFVKNVTMELIPNKGNVTPEEWKDFRGKMKAMVDSALAIRKRVS